MTSLVPVADLAREIGPFDATETERASGYLVEASDLAREIGLAGWTEAGGAKPAPVSVRLAVKAAARRAMNEDPEGFSQETLGDWSGTRSRTDLDETGVFFTAAEEAKIARAAGRVNGPRSIRTPSAYVSETGSTRYAPVEGDRRPIPWVVDE